MTPSRAPVDREDARRRRVRIAQRSAAEGLALAALFAIASLVALVVPGRTGRWLPLHLFLAGAVVAAISGVSVLFAVTWSAAPAPRRAATRTQLALVGGGAAGVATVRSTSVAAGWVAVPAVAFGIGLAMLGVLLVRAVRAGTERRFDVAAAWYIAGLAAGIAAAGLGVSLATGRAPAGARGAHVALNLLGLVGLVVGGSAPNFVATVGRTRMSARATGPYRAILLGWQVAALAGAVFGALLRHRALEAAGFAGYAGGIAALVMVLPRPARRSFEWAGPRLVGMYLSLVWWFAAAVAAAASAGAGREPLGGRVLAVLVLAGYAQLVWASAAYLVPVIRAGGHERLAAGFARTRSWYALAAFNAAGLLAAAGATTAAIAVAATGAFDALRRQVSTGRPFDA